MFEIMKDRLDEYQLKSSYYQNMDIPGNTTITDLLESYFRIYDESKLTSHESTLLSLIKEGLLEYAYDNLDYRHDDYDKNVIALESFISRDSGVPYILYQPLEVIGLINNKNIDQPHNDNSLNALSVTTEDFMLRMNQVTRDDINDFAYDLYEHGYISESLMNKYANVMMSDVLTTLDRLIPDAKGLDTTLTIEPNIPQKPIVDTSFHFPNAHFLDEIGKAIQKDRNILNDDRLHQDSNTEYLKVLLDDLDDEVQLMNDSSLKDVLSFASTALCEAYDNVGKEFTPTHKYVNDFNLLGQMYIMVPLSIFRYLNILAYLVLDIKSISFPSKLISTKHSLERNIVELTNVSDDLMKYEDKVLKVSNVLTKHRFSVVNRESEENKVIQNFHNPILMEAYGEGEVVTESLSEKTYSGQKPSELIKALTETFKVLEDGTIKVTIQRKSSYMNEYATNHRLLLANIKSGDYDAVKYNLVYDLILIENIENNVLHNKKVSKDSALYLDATKAKAFAQNDISTYLPELRKHVSNFDLNEFYSEVKADKNTFTIQGVETVSGVKKIIKSILL